MKRFLLLIAALIIGFGAKAQSTIQNFTLEDVYGNTYSLYELNAQGKYVFIYVHHTDGALTEYMDILNSAYRNYGCNMHEVFIMSICDYVEPDHIQMGAEYYGIEYPVGGDDASGHNRDVIHKINKGQQPPFMTCIAPNHEMLVEDIWPISDITDLCSNLGIEHKPCTPTTVTECTNNFSLYPNPANDHIVIEGENISDVVIYNALGQEIEHITSNSAQVVISTSTMQNGIYFARVNNEETIRFSVNR